MLYFRKYNVILLRLKTLTPWNSSRQMPAGVADPLGSSEMLVRFTSDEYLGNALTESNE